MAILGYGASYRRAFWRQRFLRGTASGAEAAVGGSFAAAGLAQRELLLSAGLKVDARLIDLGCGAGRLASALRDLKDLKYRGFDVVPELLAQAQHRAGRTDWTFERIHGARIPADDSSADMICMFSVITHIPEADAKAYLKDACRVLMPGGVLVFSFLDPAIADHRKFLRPKIVEAIVTKLFWAPNVATEPAVIPNWAASAGLRVRSIESPAAIGQSVAVLQKPLP